MTTEAMNIVNPPEIGAWLDEWISSDALPTSDEHDCPYLPDRRARIQGFSVASLPGPVYRALMDRNFRRSGKLLYRPACPACALCRQLRVRVADFRPSRSQRRVLRRNRDVTVRCVAEPQPSVEKWELFRRYIAQRHTRPMLDNYHQFVQFLYAEPIASIEFDYFADGQLAGVSLVDRCDDALSSVYMYFDPALSKRSPGTLSVLREIEHCRGAGIPYYYLGYHVAGARTMDYKARYKPHQVLDDDRSWRQVDD